MRRPGLLLTPLGCGCPLKGEIEMEPEKYRLVLQRLWEHVDSLRYMYVEPAEYFEETNRLRDLVACLGSMADNAVQHLTVNEEDRSVVLLNTLEVLWHQGASRDDIERAIVHRLKYWRILPVDFDYVFRRTLYYLGLLTEELSGFRPSREHLLYLGAALMINVCILDTEEPIDV